MDWRKTKVRNRSKKEAAQAGLNSLETLRALTAHYDAGNYRVSRDLSTILHRLIQDEFLRSGRRRDLRLPSHVEPLSKDNLLPQFGHVSLGYDHKTAEVTFTPSFRFDTDTSKRTLRFADWWGEAVFIEGAGGMGSMPTRPQAQLAFDKRKQLPRREIVRIIRNETGAHFDSNATQGTQILTTWGTWMGFLYTDEHGAEWNSLDHPEKFVFKNSVADVIVRSIAEEVLTGNAIEVLQNIS